jgi:hypothetical protein
MFLKFESKGFAAKARAVLTGVYSFFKTENKKHALRHRLDQQINKTPIIVSHPKK